MSFESNCQEYGFVILSCNGERHPANYVDMLDIYEGDDGADVVEFVCPVCDQQHASKVYRG
jgi:hypothetical protein